MSVNHAISPVRKVVLGLLAPLIYTSSVMALESSREDVLDFDIAPYIVNGTSASVSDFPSMASLFIDRIEFDGVYSTQPYCGATVLNNNFILTAAHCIYGNEYVQLFTVVVPQLQNTSEFPSGNIQKSRVSEVYYPSDYSNSLSILLPNDVAILKLESSLNVDSVNDVVKRPSNDTYRDVNNNFVAVGHGDIRSGVSSTGALQKVNLEYVDNTVCKTAFFGGSSLTDNQICFKGDFNPITRLYGGTCQGDSGGPVYWQDGTVYKQVGITSFGPSTCGGSSKATAVFTEIYDYETWINSVINGTEAAKFIATDTKRITYIDERSLSSSGGSVSFGLLGTLMLLGGFRRAMSL